MDGCMDGWMDGWVDEWMGGWMDGWVDGWMGGRVMHFFFVVRSKARVSCSTAWPSCQLGGTASLLGRFSFWMGGWVEGWMGDGPT